MSQGKDKVSAQSPLELEPQGKDKVSAQSSVSQGKDKVSAQSPLRIRAALCVSG